MSLYARGSARLRARAGGTSPRSSWPRSADLIEHERCNRLVRGARIGGFRKPCTGGPAERLVPVLPRDDVLVLKVGDVRHSSSREGRGPCSTWWLRVRCAPRDGLERCRLRTRRTGRQAGPARRAPAISDGARADKVVTGSNRVSPTTERPANAGLFLLGTAVASFVACLESGEVREARGRALRSAQGRRTPRTDPRASR